MDPDNVSTDIEAAITSLEKPGGEEQQETSQQTAPEANTGGEPGSGVEGRSTDGTNPAPIPNEVPQGGQPAPQAPGQQGVIPPQPAVKPPASWRPEVRDKFAKLDPELQQEVVRREREVEHALRTSAEARRFTEGFQQMMQPYLPFIQAENSNPMQAVQYMMNTAVALRTAPPGQKAALVADLVLQYGIDINTLDQAISAKMQGQQFQSQTDPVLQTVNQQLAPVIGYVQQLQQREQQLARQAEQRMVGELESFMQSPQNEFANDLRQEMADILELAANRGQVISLQDAYNRAIMLHPTISQVVAQRKLNQVASQRTADAQRASEAAVSVRGDAPTQGANTQRGDGGIRSDIESAFEAAANRVVR